ncbi:NADPH-dependent FMN reductase [Rhodovulum sp. DZ06]|uniref:NADPH-dependent FMN reductase n=1 Tax=Rhodovulum sp. DZ06 TaxID=3425126 RepID=UPI003D3423B4
MKILAFGASTSGASINRALAGFAASLVPGAEVELLDLRAFQPPLFSEDLEAEIGQPPAARAFLARIAAADALVVSFAEHNGSYTAAWKNLFDWASRIERKVFQDKPAVYLAASPGPGGGGSVLEAAKGSAGVFGADLRAAVSVARFHEVFDAGAGRVTDRAVLAQLTAAAGALALAEAA